VASVCFCRLVPEIYFPNSNGILRSGEEFVIEYVRTVMVMTIEKWYQFLKHLSGLRIA